MSWLTRLRNALRPGRLEEELDEEMRDHVERRTASLRASGLADKDAEWMARRRFGNVARLREESREARLAPFVEGTLQDLRYALRLMRKQPGFTATIVASLGLAIGANTAVFSILDAALLRPLPVTDPDRLIALTSPGIAEPGGDPAPERDSFSYPQLRDFRTAAGSSARLALFGYIFPADVQGVDADSPMQRASRQYVSGDAFNILGVTPALGRLFTPADDVTPGAHPVVVLGHEYWRTRFHEDRGVLGRQIIVDGIRSEIIGVTREGFTGVEPGKIVAVWEPSMQYNKDAFENAGWGWFQILGRLSPGVSPEELRVRLQPVLRDHNAEIVKRWATMPAVIRQQFLDARIEARPVSKGPSRFRKQYEKALWVIFGVALAILAIACSNVASLLLARAAARASEVAMRVSLGAGRLRLMRQLLTESALYSVAAGVLGWLLAKAVGPVLVSAFSSIGNKVEFLLPMNSRVLAFSVAVSFMTAVLFGLAPAWQASRSQPIQVMRTSSGQAGRLRLGRFFVAVQVAFAFALVMLAAAFLFSLRNLTHVDTGFHAEGVTIVEVRLGKAKLSEQAELELMRELRAKVGALAGVTGIAAARWPLFVGASWTEQVLVPGQAPGQKEEIIYPVSDGYFKTMRTALIAGRDFEERDFGKQTETPAIVSLAFAARYFPGVDPLGQKFQYGNAKHWCVITGVAANTHYGDLRQGVEPIAYMPFGGGEGDVILYVRSAGAVSPAAVDALARSVGPGLRVRETYRLESLVSDSIVQERLLAVTGGTLGGLGLVLAAIGLFGLLNYSVERRTKEIGIRAALGAGFGQIVGLVLRETVGMVAFGLVIGLVAAVVVLDSLSKLLFGVSSMDPVVVVTGSVVFLLAALIAAGLPARRAAAVDPMSALRAE